jgi:hypothetical protein
MTKPCGDLNQTFSIQNDPPLAMQPNGSNKDFT